MTSDEFEQLYSPEEVAEYWKSWDLVCGYFSGDEDKTYLWFTTENYLLGNVRPLDMIVSGRTKKLLQFIETSLAGEGA